MRKLILRHFLSPGDLVMLTAAVRDLHRCYPNQFVTDVRTSCPELWENNPYVTGLDEDDPEVEAIDCHYPMINRCNEAPFHCLHGFIEFLNDHLKLHIKPTEFKGDIHVSDLEKSWFSQVHELTGEGTPFWIVVAGGKYDLTIKWWQTERYQEVVDFFRGKIVFVQVGDQGHHHPRLEGVIDLRGKTDLRQLVRLVYHSQGVLCPVTGLMHLAAAVEVKGGSPRNRPCVVVAGGREPVHWEAYPHHQFIHTLGALPCCAQGGCWKSRTVPLGDGNERDKPENLCVDVVGELPRCMDMITAAEVIRRIELYFNGRSLNYLAADQWQAADRAIQSAVPNPFDSARLNRHTARIASERFIKNIPPYPGTFHGRGIVICAGGVTFFTNAWVCLNLLRRLGCSLPIQFWHLGEQELDQQMRSLVAPLEVECVDAQEVRKGHPARILRGWELKPYAILHCSFQEVMLLDADNVPVLNPEFLFESPQFRETGAIFWPDHGRFSADNPVWDVFGVPYRDEPEHETGQIVIDKARCWEPLKLAMWYNENSDFYYHYQHGDKDTFHLAFRKLNKPYAMPSQGIHSIEGTFCQHDFDGRRIFQHRNSDKWNLFLRNRLIPDFWHEGICREYIKQLQQVWDGRVSYYTCPEDKRWTISTATKSENRHPAITACMISCPERDEVRAQTLGNLAATDWAEEPVHVCVDPGYHHLPVESQLHNAYRALSQGLESKADYLLFLEDDLQFNRFILHNLRAWKPVMSREVTVGGLFNPGIQPLACDVPNNTFIADPASVFGSQAFFISSATVRYLLRHWDEEAGGQDHRIARLSGRLGRPIFYHVPSLVQHLKVESTWGGHFRGAADFDPLWKASVPY